MVAQVELRASRHQHLGTRARERLAQVASEEAAAPREPDACAVQVGEHGPQTLL